MYSVSTRGHKVHSKCATGVAAPAAVLARMSASMHDYTTAIDKDDGAQHDVCPTCGGHAETKARTDTTGHSYTLTCQSCHWQIPLTRPPTAAHDRARLVTDGGTDEGMRCHDCGRTHRAWTKDGEHAVDDGHHAGIIEHWKCMHCGAITEAGRR